MHWISLGIAAIQVLCMAPKVGAQMCHGPAVLPSDGGVTVGVSLRETFAAFDNATGVGDYQGLSLHLDVATEWLAVEATLPGYRVRHDGSSHYGLGDLGAAVRVTTYRSPTGSVALGPELGAMLPTGRDQDGLDMGHVMLVPGAWLSMNASAWSLRAQLAYGFAPSNPHDAHAHHAGAGLVVDPMSSSELQHGLAISHEIIGALRWTAVLQGALPAFTDGGAARETLGLGLSWTPRPFELGFDVARPIVGDPFTARMQLWAGARF